MPVLVSKGWDALVDHSTVPVNDRSVWVNEAIIMVNESTNAMSYRKRSVLVSGRRGINEGWTILAGEGTADGGTGGHHVMDMGRVVLLTGKGNARVNEVSLVNEISLVNVRIHKVPAVIVDGSGVSDGDGADGGADGGVNEVISVMGVAAKVNDGPILAMRQHVIGKLSCRPHVH